MKLLYREYTKYRPGHKPWKNGLFSAAVVFSIFLLFQPFGFRDKDLVLKLILFPAYSLVAFVYSMTNFYIVRYILKFKNKWFVKDELLYCAISLWPFTFLVHLLSVWATGDMPLNGYWYFTLLYHVASLFIITTVLEVLYYSHKSSHNVIEHLSSQIGLVSGQLDSAKQGPDFEKVSISLEKNSIDINRNKIIYIKSVGNYLELIFRDSDSGIRKLVKRGRIHQAESDLRACPEFHRCHRAFIINLKQAKQIKGNSKNARIVFDKRLEEIPVSRFQFRILKEQLDKIIAG